MYVLYLINVFLTYSAGDDLDELIDCCSVFQAADLS